MAETEDAARYFERLYSGKDRPVHAKESHSGGGEDAADFFERVYFGR